MAVKVNVKVPSRVTTNVKAESTKTSGNITVGRQGPPGVGFVGIPGEENYWGLSKSVRPTTSGDKSLGTTSYPFSDVYSDDGYINDNLYVGGNLSVTGNLDVSGNFTLGNESTDSITTKGDLIVGDDAFFSDNVNVTGDLTTRHIYPEATETYNLGSATKKWDNVYARTGHFDESTLVLGTDGARISVVNSRVQLEGTSAGNGAQFIGDTHVDGGTLFAQSPTGPQLKILNTNATNRYDFELDDNGHLNISGLLAGGSIKFDNDLLPSLNGGNLGTSSTVWNSIHATTGVLTKVSINTNENSNTLNVGGDTDIYGDLDIYDENNTSNKIVSIYDSADEGRIDIKNANSTKIRLASNSNSYFLNGNLGLGTATPSVKLEIATTDAIKIPAGTTAQRPSASDGMLRYNTTKDLFEGYSNSSWQGLGGVIDADQDSYVSTEKTADDDTLYFYTSGSERARITNNGDFNVANNLTVSGSLNVSGDFNLGDSTTDRITTQGDLYVKDDAFFSDDVHVTGDITIDGTASAAAPTQNGHLTTKLYVDSADNTLTTNLTTTGTNLQNQITSNDSDISALNAATGSLQTQVTSNDTDIAALNSATGSLQTQVTNNDSEISALNTATGSLQTQVTSNDSDITALNTATGSLQSQITSNDSDITALNSATGTLQNQVTSNDNDISALNTATGSLQTQVTSNDNDIAALNTATGSLQSQVTSNDSEISALNTATGSLQGQVTSNDSDISTLTSNLNTTGQSLLSQITSNDSDVAALNTATGSLQTQVNNLSGDAVFVTGDQTISGVKQFAGNVTIGGDFTVNGTTTTVNTSNVLVEDPVLYLGKNQTGTPTVDAGFIAERGDSTNVGFIWDESEDQFSVINTTEIADDNDITIQSYAALKAGSTTVSDLTSDNGFLFWTRNSGGTAAEIRQLGSGGILNLKNDSSTLFRVANDGNVGIGNSSPAYKLDLSGGIRVTGSAGIGSAPLLGARLYVNKASGTTTDDSIGLSINNLENGSTLNKFKYGLKINSTGSAWSQNNTATYGIHLNTNNTNTPTSYGLYMSVGGGTNTAGNIGIYVTGENKNYFSGSIGIGTTAPSFKLDVAGTSNVTGRSTFGSQVAIYDTSSSPSYSDSTGARLRVGRNAQENISFFVSDLDNTITAYQDADSNLDHSFSLNRILNGSGKSDFHIKKDGTEQLTIDKSGNTGIGTSVPAQLLHLKKDSGTTTVLTEVNSNSTIGYEIKKTGSTTQHWKIVDGQTVNGTLEFYDATDSATRMVINGSGNVGIGTPTPTVGNLQLRNSSVSILALTRTNGSTTSQMGIIRFGNTDIDSNLANIIATHDGATDSAKLVFQTQATGAATADRMTIKSDGKVGIGTTAPSHELTIGGTTSLTTARVLTTTASASLRVSTNNSDFSIMGKGNSNRFDIFDNNSLSYRLVINSAGYVGIGTTSPGHKLEVYGSVNGTYLTELKNTHTTNGYGLVVTAGDDENVKVVEFRNLAETKHFTMLGNGNVGIGTTTPSVRLDVSSTDAIKVPVGTTAQRPTAADGMIRFNSTTSKYEGYRDSAWKELGGGVIDLDEDTYVSTEKTSDDDTLFFYTAGVERAKISDQGDVFIANDLTITGTASAATPTQNGHLTTKLYVDNADSSLQSQITNNDTDIAALNTATGSLQTQVTANDADITALNTATGSLQTQVTANDADITALNTATGSLQTQVTANDADITALNTATGSLQTQVTANDTDISALNTATGVLDSTTVKLTGNQTIAGVKTFSNNAIFNGDLTVNGTTMTVDTSNVLVEDPVLLLAKNQTGSASLDAGFIAERGDDTNVGFIWDESDDHFAVINTTEDATDADITIASYADFKAGQITAGTLKTLSNSYGATTDYELTDNGVIRASAGLWVAGNGINFGTHTSNASAGGYNSDVTTRLVINNSGSVGIGTTTPSNTLDINGGLEVNGESYIRSTSNVGLRIQTTDQGITNSDGLRLGLNGTHAFLWVYENKPLALATNGAERATILGNGNFGIGTTSPDSNLDIEGTGSPELRVTDTTNTVGAYIQSNDTKTIFGSRTNHPVQIEQNAGAALYIDTSKNVGIGTTSPFTNLTVYGATDSRIALVNSNTGTSASDGFVLIAEADSDVHFLNREDSDMFFSTNGTKKMTILSGGSVGIGTSSPESLLHLRGSIPTLILHDTNSSVSGDDYGKIQWHTQDSSMPGTNDIGAEIKATDDSTYGDRAAILFSTAHNATSLTERMRIASDGNVGIGTTTPGSKLHVVGEIFAATGSTSVRTLSGILKADTIENSAGASNLKLQTEAGGNKHIEITPNGTGNVGIATSSPTAKLHVNGDARIGNPHANEDQTSRLIISNSISGSSTYDFLTLADTSNNGSETSRILFKSRYGTGAFSAGQEASFISSIRNSTSGAYHLAFGTTNDSNADAVERVRIASTGKVGIGTTNPALPLQVSDANFGQLRLTRDATDDRHWDFLVATSGYMAIKPNNSSGTDKEYITIRDGSNNEKIRLATADDSFFVGGSVGIGTSTPTQLLEVDGNIKLGDGGARDIIGPTNESLRILANPNATNEGIVFSTDGGSTTEMFIQDGGNVGIGTTSPAGRLQVNQVASDQSGAAALKVIGTAYGTNKAIHAYMSTSNATKSLLYVENSSGSVLNITGDGKSTFGGTVEITNGIRLSRTSQYENLISCEDSGGNQTLKILGNRAASNASTGTDVRIGGEQDRTTGNAFEVVQGSSTYFQIASSGAATFFGNTITAGGGTFTGSLDLQDNDKLLLGAGNDLEIFHDGSNSWITNNGTGILIIGDANGDVRIRGKSGEESIVANDDGAVELYYDNSKKLETTSGGVTITGLLTATTKSFTIDHPTKPGKKLRYGSLEGPENGVYIRGKSNNNSIELPEYWTKLVDEDSITVQLTAIGKPQQLYVERIDNNIVYVQSEENRKNISQLNYYYLIHAERIDVDKLQVEIEE